MIGQLIGGKYEIIEDIGSDSVFDLFKAKEKGTENFVFVRAIEGSKRRPDGFGDQVQQAVGRLKAVNHPGVERLISAHQETNGYYIVSEYTPGSLLEDRLKRLANLSVPAAVAMAIEICDAMSALHSAKIVHGDISTRTILSTSGEGAKLLLPGLWTAYGQDQDLALGMLKQMAPYLAPEVTSGGMPTPQSDIYALGVLLWQVLAGRTPYYGDTPSIISAKHESDPYPSLRMVAATVPNALDEIIKKCMDKNPLNRYLTAAALLNDLKAVQDALRFGRKITWPIVGPISTEEPSDVAPELNAVDGKPQDAAMTKKAKQEKRRQAREESDGLPIWIAILMYTVTAVFMLIIGGWIFFNSQKPRLLTVPDLTGKQVDVARTEIKPTGLMIRVAREQVSEAQPEGAIIETNPAPGESIRQGQRIEVTVSKGSKFVEMPDFRGRTIAEAKQLAAKLNLSISDTDIELVRDKELEQGLIVSQVPESRKKVERYTRVRLKVSNGDERVGGSRNSDAWHTNRVQFSVPGNLDQDVLVRIDVTDDQGTKTLFEELMAPGQQVDERVRWVGDELIIRIFFDGELIKQQTAKPEEE